MCYYFFNTTRYCYHRAHARLDIIIIIIVYYRGSGYRAVPRAFTIAPRSRFGAAASLTRAASFGHRRGPGHTARCPRRCNRVFRAGRYISYKISRVETAICRKTHVVEKDDPWRDEKMFAVGACYQIEDLWTRSSGDRVGVNDGQNTRAEYDVKLICRDPGERRERNRAGRVRQVWRRRGHWQERDDDTPRGRPIRKRRNRKEILPPEDDRNEFAIEYDGTEMKNSIFPLVSGTRIGTGREPRLPWVTVRRRCARPIEARLW